MSGNWEENSGMRAPHAKKFGNPEILLEEWKGSEPGVTRPCGCHRETGTAEPVRGGAAPSVQQGGRGVGCAWESHGGKGAGKQIGVRRAPNP